MTKRQILALIVLSAAFVLAGVLLYPAAGRDDAYITAFAASTFAATGRVLNLNMQAVEQSSSLAQVLLVGGFMRLYHLPAVVLGRLVSLVAGVAGLWLTALMAARTSQGGSQAGLGKAAIWVAPVLLAANASYAYWSFGGLESSLAACGWLVYLSVYQARRSGQRHWWQVPVLGFILLIRPESTLLALAFSVGMLKLELLSSWLRDRRLQLSALWASAGAAWLWLNVLLVVLIFGARWSAFGQIFPQPVVAKTGGFGLGVLAAGLGYLGSNLLSALFVGLVLLAALALWRIVKNVWQTGEVDDPRVGVLLLALGLLAFTTLTGGDWMEGGRFLVPAVPLLALLAADGLGAFANARWRAMALGLLLLVQLVGFGRFLIDDSTSIPLMASLEQPGEVQAGTALDIFESHNALQTRDRLFVPELEVWVQRVIDVKGSPVRILSGQMGMVPSAINQRFAGQVIWMDRNSLIEKSFSDCAITRGWPRDETGRLRVYYKPFNQNLAQLSSQCGIQKPDLVFDLGTFEGQAENQGFDVVFSQRGFVGAGLLGSRFHKVDLGQFIAVDEALSAKLGYDGFVKVKQYEEGVSHSWQEPAGD